jgi:hypothetical protein
MTRIHNFQTPLKTLITSVLLFFISFIAMSQDILLTVDIEDCEGEATGTVSLYQGTDLYASKQLTNGTVDFSIKTTGAFLSERNKELNITAQPNP